MSPGKHDEDCEQCEAHMVFEEKLKMLNNVPELMTYMNQEKGSKNTSKLLLSLFIGIPFTILLFLIAATRTDVNEVRLSTAKNVESISASANKISENIAVLTSQFMMHREGNFRDHEAMRKEIPTMIANQINIEKNSGKK